jgi:hypothetical protein
VHDEVPYRPLLITGGTAFSDSFFFDMNDLTLAAILRVGQSPGRPPYRRLSHPPYYCLEAVSWRLRS